MGKKRGGRGEEEKRKRGGREEEGRARCVCELSTCAAVCVCVCPQVESLTPLAAPPLHSSAPSGLPWALGPPVSAPFISPVLLLLPGQLHLDTTLPEQSPWGWGSTYVLGDLDVCEGVLAGLGRQGPDAEGRGEDGQAGGRDHFSLRTGAKRRHQSRGSTPVPPARSGTSARGEGQMSSAGLRSAGWRASP